MTWSAQFRVQDVGEGPRPIDVIAVASVEEGSLTQNTEHVKSMELRLQIDADETQLKEGDVLPAYGHFTA
jgi:hypothetical protein